MDEQDILKKHGIDSKTTYELMHRFNSQNVKQRKFSRFPQVDGKQVISGIQMEGLSLPREQWRRFLEEYLPEFSPADIPGEEHHGKVYLPIDTVRTVGILLYPYTAYGILNGGSATSYIDSKKNRTYGEQLFSSVQEVFERISPLCADRPKGSAPAYLHPDGSAGQSFLYLKVRSLMIESLRYQVLMDTKFPNTPKQPFGVIPLFQMTSEYTHKAIMDELQSIYEDPVYQDISQALGKAGVSGEYTAVQPLIAACTPYKPGQPIDIFSQAWGKEASPLALPGGHGQNFQVLQDVYRRLKRERKRFAYLGNIDNVGNPIEPVYLAVTALREADASFEFSYKTPVDVKGGILVINSEGNLDCMDIGPGIDSAAVEEHTSAGNELLFNCATGLFNLDYLVRHLDRIITSLPLRISNQDKDAGTYSQIEQITWEVIGNLDNPLVIGVDKYERFLAAKLLIEQILTSLAPKLIEHPGDDPFLNSFFKLHEGLNSVLRKRYGLSLRDNRRWELLKSEELKDLMQF